MIRVLQMVGSLNLGGSQTMIMNIYRCIDRDKIQFDFILDHPDHLYFADEVKALGGRIYFMPAFTGKNVVEIRRAWDHFFDTHQEYKILHSHIRSYASVYFPIAKKHGLITVIHSHSTSNGNGIRAVIKKFLQYPLRYEADYFLGCSKEAGEWLFGKRVVKGNKYHMLQNAINIDLYRENQKVRKEYRQELGIKRKKVFLHVGRLHPSKNHDFLLNVFAEVKKRQPDSILLMAGDGELRARIEKKIQELHLNDAVIMLGNRNDIPNLFQAADCILFPSNWEGLPMAIVEAQAAGIPCLVSNHVSKDVKISELVIYLPIDKGVDVWVNEIQNLEYRRKDVTANIRKAGFDVKATAKWIENFYRRMANG